MIDWPKAIDGGFPLPAGPARADAVAELSEALRSPDPVLRDEQAFTVASRWIPELDSAARRRLGDEMAARFADTQIQARTFAALVLAAVVEQGEFDPSWLAAFERWYPSETDLRGHDPELGWLHAVAHGADLLGTFGRSPSVDPVPLLDLAAARLLARTGHVFADSEDDRLGHAIALTLTRAELTEPQSIGWLDPVASAFATAQQGPGPGPAPAEISNTTRTLRVLYLLADRGVRPDWADGDPVALAHRLAVRERLAGVLALVAPFTG
jgi:hypothetical protein